MPSQCPKCGATTYASTLFCQSCGEPLGSTGDLKQSGKQSPATDWYGAKPNQPPQYSQPYAPQPPAHPAQYYALPQPYACRFCGSPHPPQVVKRLSAAGWVVLVIGIFFCLVGALIALAFVEEKRVCPSCGSTLN
jgi:hypothetical protein